ncbi:MAG TPA: thioredoxin domain-containing protein [Gemmatimonadaceae bacterium]|nr:thioredoxin domain-containing protein [Gemmatimonadaceae bacterium]
MNIDLRIATGTLLLIASAACKGAEDARAKTPPAASAPPAPALAAAPGNAATPAAAGAVPTTDPLVSHADSARIRGNPAAKVWLIIASDFQCPYCKMWHDSSDLTIRRDYIDNGKVRLAFVNFPINSHANAIPAAEYAMCAAAQDKFWQMHDSLFASQAKWAPLANPASALEQVAASAGVDVPALRSCVAAHKMLPLIEADREKAQRAGVRATPSFFIGTQLLEGVQPIENLRKDLDAALASAGAKQ